MQVVPRASCPQALLLQQVCPVTEGFVQHSLILCAMLGMGPAAQHSPLRVRLGAVWDTVCCSSASQDCCIANRDYNKGKKPLFWHSKFTSLITGLYQFKASQVGVLSNFATKAHQDLSVQTIYITEKLKMVNIAFCMASFI